MHSAVQQEFLKSDHWKVVYGPFTQRSGAF